MTRLLACLVVIGFAATAGVCINDEESPKHEREFRSQYQDEAGVASTLSGALASSPISAPLIAVGAAFLSAAAVMSLNRSRPRE
jgi:hypothetical protein